MNTRQTRSLTGTLIADIVLQLLSYVTQTEREFIKKRQAEGVAAAKGVKFRAQPMVRPPNYPEKLAQWQRGEISAREAALQIGITHKTFLKWIKSIYDM